MRTIVIAGVFGLGAITMGCAGNAVDESTGQSEDALGLKAPQAPAATERRVIRTTRRGCSAVTGAGGTWTGAALSGPIGVSTAFCTYEWSPRTNAPADEAALAAIAMVDPTRGKPYVVSDTRIGNPPVPGTSLVPGPGSLTWLGTPGGGGGIQQGPGAFSGGGAATPSAGPAIPFDLTAKPDVDPEGVSGCDVCVDLDVTQSWLWFVLPPYALAAPTITLQADDVVYVIPPTTTPVFYAPAPAYASYYHVSWMW